MTKTVELDVAQATLKELIADLKPDEEVVIVENHIPLARIVSSENSSSPRTPGLMKSKLTVIAEDDEHLKDFEEYMQ